MVNSLRAAIAGVFAAGLLAGAASADSALFVGTWSNGDDGQGGFFARLIGSSSEDAIVSRIVVTPAGTSAVRIHLYGRCTPECDWGTQLGHPRSEAPDSDDVRALSAEFDTGASIKRLTLRKGPGSTLRFDLTTDFKDHSGRHDYESSGSLRFVPPPPVPVASAPQAPLVGSVPVTAPATPALSGTAPATTTAAAAQPVAPAMLTDLTEDCVKINPEDVYVAPSERGWKVNDFDHTILDFGSDKVAAVKASHVMEYYRFDEQCYIARPKPKMIYWRIAGQFPRDPMRGEDCVDLHPETVSVKDGRVLDGDRVAIDFNGNDTLAAQAVTVIRTYRLNRQCFVARPSEKMVYWLSR